MKLPHLKVERWIIGWIALGTWAGLPGLAGAQCDVAETDKFVGDTATNGAQFGRAIDADGDRAIVGANGRAYVFERHDDGTWLQMQELVPDVVFGGYGKSVSIHGDIALVGCLFVGGQGGAYVFRFDGASWNQEAVLTPGGGDGGDDFGYSVAVDQDVAVIGGPQYYLRGNTGQAAVFEYDGEEWVQTQTLRPSDGEANDEFGSAVTIQGDVIAVGAYNEGNTGATHPDGTGAAYVFRRNSPSETWVEEGKLVSPDPLPGELDQFGFAIDIHGQDLLVGTNPISFSTTPAGSAYVFSYDGEAWQPQAKLTASDAQGGDRFGSAVALEDGVALCGAWGEWSIGTDCPFPQICQSGSAYLFTREGTTWNEVRKFSSSDIERDDRLAWSVALSGRTAVIGAWGDDDQGSTAGAAYGFDLIGCAPTSVPSDGNLTLGLAARPNPISPIDAAATITYMLPNAARAHLAVYDVAGRMVGALVSGEEGAGTHQVTWCPEASGVYFVRLRTGEQLLTRTLVVTW